MEDKQDGSAPRAIRAPRTRSEKRRARERITFRLLPAERGQAEACVGSTRLAAAPLTRGRRHPSVEYAMLNRLLAELQRTAGYIDQVVLHMEKSTHPEMPKLRAAQRDTREAIAAVLQRMDGA